MLPMEGPQPVETRRQHVAEIVVEALCEEAVGWWVTGCSSCVNKAAGPDKGSKFSERKVLLLLLCRSFKGLRMASLKRGRQ